jgi:hypothetical protein
MDSHFRGNDKGEGGNDIREGGKIASPFYYGIATLPKGARNDDVSQ